MPLGEFWFGQGIITNRTIYYGHDGFSGEFGHIALKEDGLPCQCGKYGCLESLASGHAIAEHAHQRTGGNRDFVAGYLAGALGVTILVKKEIFQTSHIDVSLFV